MLAGHDIEVISPDFLHYLSACIWLSVPYLAGVGLQPDPHVVRDHSGDWQNRAA
jgi:hypothetical protein